MSALFITPLSLLAYTAAIELRHTFHYLLTERCAFIHLAADITMFIATKSLILRHDTPYAAIEPLLSDFPPRCRHALR